MSQATVIKLYADFLSNYDSKSKDAIWLKQRDTFRQFWSARILSGGPNPISDDDCDAIIRILDRNGRGNTWESEAVARVMVPQGAWRRMLNEFRTNTKLSGLLNSIFLETNLERKAPLIDQLYAANEGRRNSLTGANANTINAYLAAFDPLNYLSIVSLNDRRRLIDFLEFVPPYDWEESRIGDRVVYSNTTVRDGLQALGFDGSARTLSVFCYTEPFKAMWRAEHTVKRTGKDVSVTVPANPTEESTTQPAPAEIRESLQLQAALAEIGARMGYSIWLPPADRARISQKWKPGSGVLLDELPLNYDDVTLRTIEQIDVLWLKQRYIVRAFEVEHTTSVYSGLLRMADLIALQPNLTIKLHIVAPAAKRDKVFQEIRRPVFSLLEPSALADICTYLSYDSVRTLLEEKHLDHLSADVLEEYEERAE